MAWLRGRNATGLLLVLAMALALSAAAVTLGTSRGAFSDTTDNSGNYFEAKACFSGSSTYDFTGVTSPSSTHTGEDGEIDQLDSVIENGTFSARRNTIGGWANWAEATTAEYSNLVGSDNLYYQGADPGLGDNAAMIFEFDIAETDSCITQIDVNVEAAQGGVPGADLLFVYLWDYATSSYLVGGSMNGTTDQVVSFSVTTNPGDYVQTSDGELTLFVVNEDDDDWIRIDDITLNVTTNPTAAVSGTVTPSATEGEIVAGSETLIITLTNDTWDATVGGNNSVTTDLINGIDSAQSEAAGWDAVVKANMDYNDVTRTSDTVVTITLGAEATYNITADETITVTVPATAVASAAPITATPTFNIGTASAAVSGTVVPSATEAQVRAGGQTLIITLTNEIWDATVGGNNSITTDLINGIDSAQSEAAGWDAVVKANMDYNDVTRTSDTVVTITLGAEPTYNMTATETITVTVPASAVASAGSVTAAPTFNVTPNAPVADLSGTVVPSAIELDVVNGGKTLIITLTDDTWDATVGGNNSVTTDLINGIDSAQSEAAGWDAVVKVNMDFNDVTRTSDTVVTIILGAEATYNITADETITVTVPATAVASGGPITATPTFVIGAPAAALSGTVVGAAAEQEIVAGGQTLIITLTNDTWDATVGGNNSVTTDLINGIDSAQSEATGWDAVVKANMDFNDVTRTSDTVVTITLGAEATYNITAHETITVTVPASAVASADPYAATPNFNVVAAGTTVASDTFTEASNTLLENHTPDIGTGWTVKTTGELCINASLDRLRIGANEPCGGEGDFFAPNGARENTEFGDDDMDVTVDVIIQEFGGPHSGGPAGRIPAGGFDAMNMYYVAYDDGQGRWELHKIVAGTDTTLGSWAETLAMNDVRTVKLEIRTATKKVYIAGVERISSTDDSLVGNSFAGLYGEADEADNGPGFDNFLSVSAL